MIQQHQESKQDEDSRLPVVFYDGDCGLCHGFVKYVLKRDVRGVFHFGALQGATIRDLLGAEKIDTLPDSIVVLTEDQDLLVRSDAVVFVLRRLPRTSPFLANCISVFPQFLRDFGYDAVARVRKKIIPKPEGVCPLVPQELRAKFLP